MTKRARPKPKRRRNEFFIVFEFWELESPAFQHLSADATRVYMFMRKRLSFDNSNNGAVAFSHREATEALNTTGWRRGSNALAELEHFGFIKLRNCGVPGPSIRPASEWQLTAFPCGGQEPSKDFMRWDGAVFERPHTGKLGSATRKNRESQKQLPIGKMPTRRRQHADAFAESPESQSPRIPKTVGNIPTDSPPRRRQHADTITITREGGPDRRARVPGESWPAQVRRARGMNQAALARVIGISRSYLAAVEQGRRHPTPQTVTAISRALAYKPLIAPKAEQRRTRLQPKRASPADAPARHRPRNSGTAWPVRERLALGLNQPEFAQRAGIKREYLSMIEHGRCKPGPSTRARIEAALKPTEH